MSRISGEVEPGWRRAVLPRLSAEAQKPTAITHLDGWQWGKLQLGISEVKVGRMKDEGGFGGRGLFPTLSGEGLGPRRGVVVWE